MKIHNLRLGFACNSSSTHSVVLLEGGAADYDVAGREFGGDLWTAGSKDAKRDYLAICIRNQLSRSFGNEAASMVANKMTGASVNCDDGDVDHQSEWTMPLQWDGTIDADFVAELQGYLMRDDVVLLGGNDNDDLAHDLLSAADLVPFARSIPKEQSPNPPVARHDPSGFWTLFYRDSGHKVRLSFNDAPAPTRASVPELIDIKITNYCPFYASSVTCKNCYQGSDLHGAHAKLETIQRFACKLGQARVFEVAIGGGEPTMHPQFAEILASFRLHGVVPNFTTRTLAWTRDVATVAAVARHAGTFALSIEDPKQIAELRSVKDALELPREPVAQVVLGSCSLDTLKAIFHEAKQHNISLTMLGWKRTGRASSEPPHDITGWIDLARNSGLWMIGMDTEAVKQWGSDLGERMRVFITEHEGAFSGYIDAVDLKFGPSSFCAPNEFVPIRGESWDPLRHFDMATAFASFA